jgi:hypothetical protein
MALTNKLKLGMFFGIMALLCVLAYVYGMNIEPAKASVSFTVAAKPSQYQNYTFFSATTTTATSTNVSDGGSYLVINNAKKITMYFTHGGTATTSTTGARFNVQTTRDGTNWDNFNQLIDSSGNATTSYTIQGATSTAYAAVDISKNAFYGIRCISTELASPLGTDGEQTCAASVDF